MIDLLEEELDKKELKNQKIWLESNRIFKEIDAVLEDQRKNPGDIDLFLEAMELLFLEMKVVINGKKRSG